MSDDTHIETGPAARADEGPFNPAGELVRFAEKLLEQGDIAQALECLHEALKRQPENLYIPAVIERAEMMGKVRAQPPRGPQSKPLSVTVDNRHPTGVRPEATESAMEVDARVRRLTLIASRLFDRGAFDAAFESLMKAYLLDPGNPLVVACEKQMMPVWNTLRKTGFPGYAPEQFIVDRNSAHVQQPRAIPPAPAPPVEPIPATRLEERERQLEQQRKEREQTMWRTASQLPKNMTPPPVQTPAPSPRPPVAPRLRDLDKHDRPGLFRWLKGE